MYGDQEEEISGTELAAEWTFSSLQKFGQEFLKKLKGKKLPNKLLEKVGNYTSLKKSNSMVNASLGTYVVLRLNTYCVN